MTSSSIFNKRFTFEHQVRKNCIAAYIWNIINWKDNLKQCWLYRLNYRKIPLDQLLLYHHGFWFHCSNDPNHFRLVWREWNKPELLNPKNLNIYIIWINCYINSSAFISIGPCIPDGETNITFFRDRGNNCNELSSAEIPSFDFQ